MSLAYVDTSCLAAIAFGETGHKALAKRLSQFDLLVSSNLLEAELKAALAREREPNQGGHLLSWITWVYPDRPLTQEFDRILSNGLLKGADLWHLACALFLDPGPVELAFCSLDERQSRMARELGFPGL